MLSRLQGRIDAYAHALRRHALTVTRLEGVEACLDEANKLDKATMAQARLLPLTLILNLTLTLTLTLTLPLTLTLTLTMAQAEDGGLATSVWKNMSHELPPLPVDVVLPF